MRQRQERTKSRTHERQAGSGSVACAGGEESNELTSVAGGAGASQMGLWRGKGEEGVVGGAGGWTGD